MIYMWHHHCTIGRSVRTKINLKIMKKNEISVFEMTADG